MKQESASLQSNRYELSKVTIDSPIDGIVTRRSIEEGETVVIGTMNNPGTVLLTIADMSIIEAEVEVDETNVPSVVIGQPARVVIDALPGRTFTGHVTEIGNSPIQQPNAGTQSGSTSRQATNFKVSVTLDEQIPDVRPGFTCTADITTSTRAGVIGVPIQAVTVREMIVDGKGAIVRRPRRDRVISRPPRRLLPTRSSSLARPAASSRACFSSATVSQSSRPSRSESPANATSSLLKG